MHCMHVVNRTSAARTHAHNEMIRLKMINGLEYALFLCRRTVLCFIDKRTTSKLMIQNVGFGQRLCRIGHMLITSFINYNAKFLFIPTKQSNQTVPIFFCFFHMKRSIAVFYWVLFISFYLSLNRALHTLHIGYQTHFVPTKWVISISRCCFAC